MLYDLYSVVSNKTVRKNEKYYKKFKKRNKEIPGTLVKTNRGYFIDGYNVDKRSSDLWLKANGYENTR